MSLIRHRSPVVVDGDPSRPPAAGRRRRSARTTSPVRRLGRGALVVAAGTAALALGGPFALRPFAAVAGAAGDVTVAFVLDFGGTPANVVSGCVTIPPGDTGYDALSAFTASRGLAVPTYNAQSLLCSIDGTPSSGCGQMVGGGQYIYWSYFTGVAGSWQYSSTGAFGTVTTGDVQGWRFQDPGSGRPNDPAPRATARFDAICPAAASTTTTTVPTPTTAPTPPPAGAGTEGGTTGGAGAVAAGTPTPTGARTSASSGPASSTTTTSAAPGSSAASTTPVSSSPTAAGTTHATGAPTGPQVGVVAVTHHVAPGAGPGALIAGGLLIAGLALAAWVRWRRRPGTP